MESDKYLEFVYREYQARSEETEGYFQRYQLAIGGIALLGGLSAFLTRLDFLRLIWLRIDVFLYYLATAAVALMLLLATVAVSASVWPRVFQRLNRLSDWNAWRSNYRKLVSDSQFGIEHPDKIDAIVDRETSGALIDRLIEACDQNARVNRAKLRACHYSTYCLVAAIVFIAAQSLMRCVLFLGDLERTPMVSIEQPNNSSNPVQPPPPPAPPFNAAEERSLERAIAPSPPPAPENVKMEFGRDQDGGNRDDRRI
ncbi:MAG: hypothetical protein JNM94_08130 [Phycisphaerae bacterium]|nr:hypothetical protein [Phycisphaerae bacterium]